MKLRAFFRFAVLLAADLVLALSFRTMNLISGFTDVRPVVALEPVYAVFFGPAGCLASGLGNLLADEMDSAICWTSIADFAMNFLGHLLVLLYWTPLSRSPFSLHTLRDLMRHSLLLVAMSFLETAILAPSIALVYPEIDAVFFAQTVFFNLGGKSFMQVLLETRADCPCFQGDSALSFRYPF